MMNEATANLVRLGQAAHIAPGHPFRGAIDTLSDGDIGVVQMRDVGEDGVAWNAIARVRLPSARNVTLLHAGDVIFTTRGTRNFALALEHMPMTAVCAPHFFILSVAEPSRLLPSFLAWQLNQRPAQNYFQQRAQGSNILNIDRTAIENLELVIPPVDRQIQALEIDQALRHERLLLGRLIENTNRQANAIAMQLLNGHAQQGSST